MVLCCLLHASSICFKIQLSCEIKATQLSNITKNSYLANLFLQAFAALEVVVELILCLICCLIAVPTASLLLLNSCMSQASLEHHHGVDDGKQFCSCVPCPTSRTNNKCFWTLNFRGVMSPIFSIHLKSHKNIFVSMET